jgi:alpha-ketoglutarate-dependent taurine dioxygenase
MSMPVEVSSIALSVQREFDGRAFPFALACRSSDATLPEVAKWIEASREELVINVEQHGAILFRGFPLQTAEDFDAFIVAFGFENFPYEQSLSNAVRVNRTDRVFTANEAPPDVNIYLHHEMAQTPIYPSKLFFFCEKAAENGGSTPICRSDVLYERLCEERPEFARSCEVEGLRYTNVMPPQSDLASGMGRSWQSTFSVEAREEAEERLKGLAYSWEWLPDGCLRATTPTLPAVRQIDSSRKSFFNQLIAAFQGWRDSRNDPSKSITFGDGSPLDPADVAVAVRLADELTFEIPWQTGDVALVDNYVVMHGRRTFEGTRKVLASLVAAES